jgi:hypothetical protein
MMLPALQHGIWHALQISSFSRFHRPDEDEDDDNDDD